MVKSIWNYVPEGIFGPDLRGFPEPPERPKYDPKSEPPKWSWSRLWHGSLTPDERVENWPPIGDIPEESDKPDWRGVVRDNVIELPMPERVSYGQRIDPKYFFFDTPDYADPFKKMWWCAKFFLRTGLLAACTVGIVEGKKASVQHCVQLFNRIVKPWFLGGMVTSVSVITIANLRGRKDDYNNYIAAGLVTACFMGRYDHYKFARGIVIWPILAYSAKYNAECNGIMYPTLHPRIANHALSGMSNEHGWRSGDLRFGITGWPDGVGRGRESRDISKY